MKAQSYRQRSLLLDGFFFYFLFLSIGIAIKMRHSALKTVWSELILSITIIAR